MNASPPTHAETAERLDTILASVLLLVAACFRILGARTVPLWNRISRSRQNLAHLLARLAAGHKPRIRKPAAIAAEAAPTQPAPTQPAPTQPEPTPLGGAVAMPIPRRPLWLVIQLGYRAAGFGSQLNHLLHEPGVAETLAAAPGIARTLRPLCRMLGVDLPPALRLPPRPAKSRPEKPPPENLPPEKPVPRAPKPRAAPPAHRHPIYPQRKPPRCTSCRPSSNFDEPATPSGCAPVLLLFQNNIRHPGRRSTFFARIFRWISLDPP